MPARARGVGEVLLEMGAIDPQQLLVATSHAQQWNMPIEQAVLERRFCSVDDVVRAFSRMTGYPVLNLDLETLDPAHADLLPLQTAEAYRMVPLKLSGRRYEVLELAVAVPPNLEAIDAVLALTKKQRAQVHLAHSEAVYRAIDRLYRPGQAPAPVAAPPPERKVDVQNEQTFDFGEEPALSPTTVWMYGWHPAAGKAMAMMLQQGGLRAEPLDDVGLASIGQFEVVITTTLALRTVLPADARLKCHLIICGTQEPGDSEDARSLGARLYLKPPHSTEQLTKAVQHVLRPR